MNGEITKETLAQLQAACRADLGCRVAKNAVTENGLLAAAKNAEAQRSTRHSFSVNLKQGKITNQKQSGRCWMFAALNTFRFEIIRRLGLEGKRELAPEERQAAETACNEALNATAAQAALAANLLELENFGPIVRNVAEKGLAEIQREILFLHVKEKPRRELEKL